MYINTEEAHLTGNNHLEGNHFSHVWTIMSFLSYVRNRFMSVLLCFKFKSRSITIEWDAFFFLLLAQRLQNDKKQTAKGCLQVSVILYFHHTKLNTSNHSEELKGQKAKQGSDTNVFVFSFTQFNDRQKQPPSFFLNTYSTLVGAPNQIQIQTS